MTATMDFTTEGALEPVDQRQAAGKAVGFEVAIASDEHLDRFCRVLATLVNQSPMHLDRVVVDGTVVYPVPRNSPEGTVTVRRCRFKVRHTGHVLDEGMVQDALGAIGRRYDWEQLVFVRS